MRRIVAVGVVVVVVAVAIGVRFFYLRSQEESQEEPQTLVTPTPLSRQRIASPTIYVQSFGKMVMIVRDEMNLGMEPQWSVIWDEVSRCLGAERLKRRLTLEVRLVEKVQEEHGILLRDVKEDQVRVASVQVGDVKGKPEACRGLLHSSFLYLFTLLKEEERKVETKREMAVRSVMTAARTAYMFDAGNPNLAAR